VLPGDDGELAAATAHFECSTARVRASPRTRWPTGDSGR
jgi:hypothetical protein